METDVVVIGTGLSGLSTAISASRNGLNVVLIEKSSVYGITFLTSFGNFMDAQVEENKEYHLIESADTLQAALERWNKMTNQGGDAKIQYPDYSRVEQFIVESAKTVMWLQEMGVAFQPSFNIQQRGADGAKVVKDGEEMEGATLISGMSKMLDAEKVTTLFSTRAYELLNNDGKVVGVKAVNTNNNKEYEVLAKAIVLATGGFGGDEAYLEQLIPQLSDVGYQFTGNTLNTGDGMKMAEKVGAAIYESSWIIPSPGVLLPAKDLTDLDREYTQVNAISRQPGNKTSEKLLVNNVGARFTNEANPGVVLVADMLDGQTAPYYMVFDSSSEDLVKLLDKGLVTKHVFKADSIKDLASEAGLAQLEKSFEEYQEAAELGEDRAFGKTKEFILPYDAKGPYYLVHMVPNFVATIGGVKTNSLNQAITDQNVAINGLFAVGEVAHRFLYNRAHFGNASNSASVTMGRLLGEHLADIYK